MPNRTDLTTRHIQKMDAKIQGFIEALEGIAEEWKPRVSALASDLESFRNRSTLRMLKELSTTLKRQLNELGFSELAKQIVEHYDVLAEYALEATRAIDTPRSISATLTNNALKQVRDIDLSAYEHLGNQAVTALARSITTDVLVGLERRKIIQNVEAVIDDRFLKRTKTYVDTATRQIDRSFTFFTAKEAGIETFKFFGPADKLNSEFCREHVGKIYTLEQIKNMDNGIKEPWNDVMQYGGHPGCRHVWQMHQE